MPNTRKLFTIIGLALLIAICGFTFSTIYSQGNSENNKKEIDLRKIEEEMEDMTREEIEETIKKIEEEILRLQSGLR